MLKTTCKTDLTASENCLKIAKIMQENSFGFLGTVLGNAIQLDLLENLGDQESFKKLKQKDESFRNGYMCLSKSLYNEENRLDNSFNLEYFQIANKLEREKGELTSLKKQAELNYQYQLSKGNKKAVNPQSCFK